MRPDVPSCLTGGTEKATELRAVACLELSLVGGILSTLAGVG